MTPSRSVNLAFERSSGLPTVFPVAGMQVASIILESILTSRLYSDYSGLPILRTALSSDEELTSGLWRFWIYGCESGPQVGDAHTHPFLFINGGAATLSTTSSGAALIKNGVTQRSTQLLEHEGNSILTCRPQSVVLNPI